MGRWAYSAEPGRRRQCGHAGMWRTELVARRPSAHHRFASGRRMADAACLSRKLNFRAGAPLARASGGWRRRARQSVCGCQPCFRRGFVAHGLDPLSLTDLPLGQPTGRCSTTRATACSAAATSSAMRATPPRYSGRVNCAAEDSEPVRPNANSGRAGKGPLGLPVGTLLHAKRPEDNERCRGEPPDRLHGARPVHLLAATGRPRASDRGGQSLLLRGFPAVIYSFRSTITAVCRSPFRYRCCRPDRCGADPRAQGRTRHYASPPSWARAGGEGEERLVMLSDLSLGRAAACRRAGAHAGQPGAPALPVAYRGRRQRTRHRRACAQSAGEAEDAGFPAFGVAFDSLGERELTLLHCFIYEQLLSGARLPL